MTNNPTVAALVLQFGGPMPDRLTPDWLETVGTAAAAAMANGRDDLSELYWLSQTYRRCATWMRQRHLAACHCIGPVRPNPFKKGDVITVRKGETLVRDGQYLKAKTTYRVTLSFAGAGSTDEDTRGIYVRSPLLGWGGAGSHPTTIQLWQYASAAELPARINPVAGVAEPVQELATR